MKTKKISITISVFFGLLFIGTAQDKLKIGKEITTESGLKITLTEKGKGRIPIKGETVKVHYTGNLLDGTKFDSSLDRGEPLPFKLGIGQVIKGWDEGVGMLTKGSKAKLVIPPNLAYGDRDMGTIKPNATLIFTVELVDIIERPKPFNVAGKDTIHMESGLKYIKLYDCPQLIPSVFESCD